jgi:hypothetical protein
MQARIICVWVICSALAGCPRDENSRSGSQAVTSGVGSCDMTPIAVDPVTLPACAAGTSGSAGPGVPFDYDKEAVPPYAPSPPEIAATAAANALAVARNPVGQSALDRGFASPPTGGSGAAQ